MIQSLTFVLGALGDVTVLGETGDEHVGGSYHRLVTFLLNVHIDRYCRLDVLTTSDNTSQKRHKYVTQIYVIIKNTDDVCLHVKSYHTLGSPVY